MSYNDLEVSRDAGKPISLYLFEYGVLDGATGYYAYTDSEQDVLFDTGVEHQGSITFEAISVDRGNIQSSGTLDKSTLVVTSPNNTPLANLFRVVPPSSVVNLTIYDLHVGDGDARVAWVGHVLGVASAGNEKQYSCEPATVGLKKKGIVRNWQRGCPLLLYAQGDYQCNANEAAATTTVAVATVNGPILTLPANWLPAGLTIDDYTGGMVKYTNSVGIEEIRGIINFQDAVTILLDSTTTGLVAGVDIRVILGCSHDQDGCNLHANILNYGGQDWIPEDNPTGVKNIFY